MVAPALYFTTTIVLGLLIVLAGTRLSSGAMYFGAMVLVAIAHAMWTASAYRLRDDTDEALLVLAFQVAAVLLFTWWPFAAGSAVAGEALGVAGGGLGRTPVVPIAEGSLRD